MLKILVVDDDPLLVEVVKHKLSLEKFEVLTVDDGTDAIEILSSDEIDIVILDAMLPGLDGFSVMKEMKEHDRTKEIPVIFLTARNHEKDILNGFSLGASDYISKPFSPNELVARIKNIINRKNLIKEDNSNIQPSESTKQNERNTTTNKQDKELSYEEKLKLIIQD